MTLGEACEFFGFRDGAFSPENGEKRDYSIGSLSFQDQVFLTPQLPIGYEERAIEAFSVLEAQVDHSLLVPVCECMEKIYTFPLVCLFKYNDITEDSAVYIWLSSQLAPEIKLYQNKKAEFLKSGQPQKTSKSNASFWTANDKTPLIKQAEYDSTQESSTACCPIL